MLRPTALFPGLLAVFVAGFALGGQAIPNWSAPATWTPTRASGVHTLSDVTNPIPFIGVTPCRVADTRGNGFSGLYGPPSIGANTTRTFVIVGQCGIPASARAVSFNFTALNVSGAGDLRVFPDGGAVPLVSTINYNANTPNIANAAIVPLGTTNGITVQADTVTIDLIIDVNGYYYDGTSISLAPGEQFRIIANVGGAGAIYGSNLNGAGFGVWGNNVSGIGVYGTSTSYNGVWAQSGTLDGLAAFGGRDGGYLQGARHGVVGASTATSGITYGVIGKSSSTTFAAGGVFGQDSSAYNPVIGSHSLGVLGSSQVGFGVFGESRYISVYGQLHDSADTQAQFGLLGTTYGSAADSTTGPWGVYSGGNLGVSGVKHFVEPHPADPKKVILYSSLEGREVGTYFRGTARVINHQAVIEIPEDFRIVTDEDGLTVQLTPVGASSSMYVESQDLNQIVVRATRDVTFHYFVQGVRRAFKDLQPVQIGYVFMPQSATDNMPLYLTEEAKRRLIANGTYNQDGTVNMETAERAGFTRIWQQRLEDQKAAADAARTAAAKAHLP